MVDEKKPEDQKNAKPKAVSVTWLGDGSDAEENTWNGMTFKKGEAVEVKDEAMVETAKQNKFYKVAGNDAETVEDQPVAALSAGRPDDIPINIAFAPQEVLTARREESKRLQEEQAERDGEKPERGESRTFAERVPPKPGRPATADRRESEHR